VTKREEELLGRLDRRAEHLQNRSSAAGERDLSWDKGELAALRWAIEFIHGALNGANEGPSRDDSTAREATLNRS